MQIHKQKPKKITNNKHEQIPESVPVIDNSDLLDRLNAVSQTQEEEGTDFESMDDGSSIDGGGSECGCW